MQGADGDAIIVILDVHGICITISSAWDNETTELSHVLKAIDLGDEYAKGTIRISLGKNNTMKDVEKIVSGLKKILVK